MPGAHHDPGHLRGHHESYAMDDFAKTKIAATNKELVEERETVQEMLG